MIWAQASVKPEITLIGEYLDQTVVIYLTNQATKHELYRKIVVGLSYEDPTREEVRNKFFKKFQSCLERTNNKHKNYFRDLGLES